MAKLIASMIIMTGFLTFSQLILKRFLSSFESLGDVVSSFPYLQVIRYAELLGVTGCMVGAALIWVNVLKRNEFSVVYPMVAFSYVWALVAGYFFLAEPITSMKLIGVILVGVGILLISA